MTCYGAYGRRRLVLLDGAISQAGHGRIVRIGRHAPARYSSKYALIDAEKAIENTPFTVGLMCTALGVSRSGFYEWAAAAPSARARRRVKVEVHVRAAFAAGRGTYGVRRVHAIVSRSDDPEVASASPKLVRAIMAQLGLRACQPRAYRVTTLRGRDEPATPDPSDGPSDKPTDDEEWGSPPPED